MDFICVQITAAIFTTCVPRHLAILSTIHQTSKFKTNIIKAKRAIYLYFMAVLSQSTDNKNHLQQREHVMFPFMVALITTDDSLVDHVQFLHTLLLCSMLQISEIQPRPCVCVYVKREESTPETWARFLEINNRNKEIEYLLYHCSMARKVWIHFQRHITHKQGWCAAHCVLGRFF